VQFGVCDDSSESIVHELSNAMHAKDIWNTKHFDSIRMAQRLHHVSCRTSIRTGTPFIAPAISVERGETLLLAETSRRANVKHQRLLGASSLHVRLLQ
jgi:hypothetical protein